MCLRREETKTINWLAEGSGIRKNIADVQVGMVLEIRSLKRQSRMLYHSILRGHTKARKIQEKERLIARRIANG